MTWRRYQPQQFEGGVRRYEVNQHPKAKIKAENQDWTDINDDEDKISHVLV